MDLLKMSLPRGNGETKGTTNVMTNNNFVSDIS